MPSESLWIYMLYLPIQSDFDLQRMEQFTLLSCSWAPNAQVNGSLRAAQAQVQAAWLGRLNERFWIRNGNPRA